ncbi:MAG: hypothetical protein PHC89_02485 [Candidatus Pacebacteria bacterium]|nr:hypothetical protein [Candidatus Paceibacterota bacterium]
MKKTIFGAILLVVLLSLFAIGISLGTVWGATLILLSLGGFYLLRKNQEVINFLEELSEGL